MILLFSFQSLILLAQDNHFIYLQTENNQPFYVRMNGKVFSSTTAGYVILPKLATGNYQLNIGFPKNEFPEESYQVSLGDQNEGFLLKNLGNEWSLFNIETLALIAGNSTAPETNVKIQDDPFSSMLANVVKDSSLLRENIPASSTQPKPGTEPVKQQTAVTIPSSSSEKTTVPEENNNHQPVEEVPVTKEQVVASENNVPAVKPFTRLMLMNEADGLDLVYVDNKEKDTIRIFMPVNKETVSEPEKQPKIIYQPKQEENNNYTITPTIVNPEEVHKEEKKDIVEEKKTATIIYEPEVKKEEKEEKDMPQVVQSSEVNSDCKSFATSYDFLKLRKKMAAESDNDKMLDVARKYFKNKCFSTEQIRNLSYLFLTDEGKYRFFDLAYAYTADSDVYYKLATQMKDPYYINRFKAMIHK